MHVDKKRMFQRAENTTLVHDGLYIVFLYDPNIIKELLFLVYLFHCVLFVSVSLDYFPHFSETSESDLINEFVFGKLILLLFFFNL